MEPCCFILRKNQGGEGTEAIKRKPWDTELPCNVSGPPLHHIGYDAARRRALLTEPHHERLTKRGACLHEVAAEVFGLKHVQALAPIRQAKLCGWERERHQLHCQAGRLHCSDEACHPGGVHRSGDKADLRAVLGQQAGHVCHGDGVSLRHHRDQHEVRLHCRGAALLVAGGVTGKGHGCGI